MAAKSNFSIDQGADAVISFVLKNSEGPIDLSGYSAAMQMRVSHYATEAVDTLTTDNGRLVLDALNGKITAIFPNAITEKYQAQSVVYDIEIENADGIIKRVLEGNIQIKPEVTRVRNKRSS